MPIAVWRVHDRRPSEAVFQLFPVSTYFSAVVSSCYFYIWTKLSTKPTINYIIGLQQIYSKTRFSPIFVAHDKFILKMLCSVKEDKPLNQTYGRKQYFKYKPAIQENMKLHHLRLTRSVYTSYSVQSGRVKRKLQVSQIRDELYSQKQCLVWAQKLTRPDYMVCMSNWSIIYYK